MPSNSPAFDAANILATAGIVALTGSTWPVKLGQFQTAPDAQVCIYDAPGQAPNPKWLLDYPALAILVRGHKDAYEEARLKCVQIKGKLLGMDPVNMATADRWNGVTMLSDIQYLKNDENSRPVFSMNFRVILEPAVANSPLTSRESL